MAMGAIKLAKCKFVKYLKKVLGKNCQLVGMNNIRHVCCAREYSRIYKANSICFAVFIFWYMIKGENLKIASIGSSSYAAWNILILPHITPKGTVNFSASTGHFCECSVSCQRPRNHVGQNTWTMWYTLITARNTNQLATHRSSSPSVATPVYR